jgi:hypothetical protein
MLRCALENVILMKGGLAMPNQRRGVLIGGYVTPRLKDWLQRRAAAHHRTLTKELERILEDERRRTAPAPVQEQPARAEG